MYDGDEWTLSPAYDLTFAPNPTGYRQTSVLDASQNVSRQNLLDLATRLGLSKQSARTMLEQVLDAASGVGDVLNTRGCTHAVSERATHDVLAHVRRLSAPTA